MPYQPGLARLGPYPTRHEGPSRRAQSAKTAILDKVAADNADRKRYHPAKPKALKAPKAAKRPIKNTTRAMQKISVSNEINEWLDEQTDGQQDGAADLMSDIIRSGKNVSRKAKSALRTVKRQSSDTWRLPPATSQSAQPKPDASKSKGEKHEEVRRGKPRTSGAQIIRDAAIIRRKKEAVMTKKKGPRSL
jgi:hypothetical protein